MTSVDLVYLNAGGGHRASALALQQVIRDQGHPWNVRLVNLVDTLDRRQLFRRLTGMPAEDIYNRRLARGWTRTFKYELKALQCLIRIGHPALVRALRKHWLETRPDLVVSLIPNFNRAMCLGLNAARPGVPLAVVMTDLSDLPPHFWIERGLAQHIVCGSQRAAQQARSMGYGPHQVSLTSGMILRPELYRRCEGDPRGGRSALGLDPDRPTGVVVFGAQGSMQMLDIARALPEVQLILVCGHNLALAAKLRARDGGARHAVLGFTPSIGAVLQLADFFIGKPGPGSLSEALHHGLPVITFENAATMPQERYNAEWVREHGFGMVLRDARSLGDAVATLLADLERFKTRVTAFENRAVFEVPAILSSLLTGASRPTSRQADAVTA